MEERGGGGGGQAVGVELGQEPGGQHGGEGGGLGLAHDGEDGRAVEAEVTVLLGEAGEGREEHDLGELLGQADLAQPGQDLVEPAGLLVGVGLLGVRPGRLGVGPVLERRGPEPEPGLAGRADGSRE